jgi:SAM-dependent methyltransferase
MTRVIPRLRAVPDTGAMRDPLAGSSWSAPGTVSGFAQSPPNERLVRFADSTRFARSGRGRALDLGCGAGRNAVPLAARGWQVLGIDLSWPMLEAAAGRAFAEGVTRRVRLALAPMEALPVRDRSIDLVIAHGIWNLATSGAQFRRAVREAARVARPGAGLFVFTFSRNTLPASAVPIAGESFVFTEFSGTPQCFLTERQLIDELAAAGFVLDGAVRLAEHNRPRPGTLQATTGPVIYEASFQRQ